MKQTREEIEAWLNSDITLSEKNILKDLGKAYSIIRQLLDQTAPPKVKEGVLLPCPFCGSEQDQITIHSDGWSVRCESCLAGTDKYKHKTAAYNNWNNRALPPPPQEQTAWRPIEEAPKDGTHIWLFVPGAMRVGFFAPGKGHENFGTVDGGWIDYHLVERGGGPRGLRFAPTHWMPLPLPPEGAE